HAPSGACSPPRSASRTQAHDVQSAVCIEADSSPRTIENGDLVAARDGPALAPRVCLPIGERPFGEGAGLDEGRPLALEVDLDRLHATGRGQHGDVAVEPAPKLAALAELGRGGLRRTERDFDLIRK